MENTYEGLIKIFDKGVNKWGNLSSMIEDENDPYYGREITVVAEEFMSKQKELGIIRDYSVESFCWDGGPASEPGVCFVCWVDTDGELNTASCDWET